MSPPDDFEVRVGDALEELAKLPDGCVQTTVCSPPYWGLRDYGVDGQLGLEPTPEAYVEKLVAIFGEVRRVLRDDGTLWLNLGDSYAGSSGDGGETEKQTTNAGSYHGHGPRMGPGLKPKDMVGIPWRVAFALQQDGWWLRSDIIWHKPNPMPESVTDRPTNAHEHIFLLAKSKRYYYDHEAVKEESHHEYSEGHVTEDSYQEGSGRNDGTRHRAGIGFGQGTVGKRNKRDVWTVTTKPFPDAHFAVYPPELITPCIQAGTSQRGQCVECGAPWERVVERDVEWPDRIGGKKQNEDRNDGGRACNAKRTTETVGWTPTCDCDADTEPQLVLDPFCGAGTTGVVCTELGRRFLGIELNPEYAEMSRERIMGTNPTLFRGTA